MRRDDLSSHSPPQRVRAPCLTHTGPHGKCGQHLAGIHRLSPLFPHSAYKVFDPDILEAIATPAFFTVAALAGVLGMDLRDLAGQAGAATPVPA
jgi:hypothetical protein